MGYVAETPIEKGAYEWIDNNPDVKLLSYFCLHLFFCVSLHGIEVQAPSVKVQCASHRDVDFIPSQLLNASDTVSYTHLTLPTILRV